MSRQSLIQIMSWFSDRSPTTSSVCLSICLHTFTICIRSEWSEWWGLCQRHLGLTLLTLSNAFYFSCRFRHPEFVQYKTFDSLSSVLLLFPTDQLQHFASKLTVQESVVLETLKICYSAPAASFEVNLSDV